MWKTVIIDKGERITLDSGWLVVALAEKEARLPIEDGYATMQYSVYCRTIRNHDDAEKHLQRVKNNLPGKGSVRALIITEKQYENMQILLGEGYANGSLLDSNDLLVL